MEVAVPDHEGFLTRLRVSHYFVWRVGSMLLETGVPIQIERLEEAATPWEGSRFSEQNDIVVDGHHIVEVKAFTRPFTCAADYPFDDANLCSVKRWEARVVKPLAFVLISQATLVPLVVWSSTYSEWVQAWSRDGERGTWTWIHRAPRHTLRPFSELMEAFTR